MYLSPNNAIVSIVVLIDGKPTFEFGTIVDASSPVRDFVTSWMWSITFLSSYFTSTRLASARIYEADRQPNKLNPAVNLMPSNQDNLFLPLSYATC